MKATIVSPSLAARNAAYRAYAASTEEARQMFRSHQIGYEELTARHFAAKDTYDAACAAAEPRDA